MSVPCLLTAIVVGVFAAALSDLLPAAALAEARNRNRPELATTCRLRRYLLRILLFAAPTLFLVMALELQCEGSWSLVGLLEVIQVGLFVLIAGIDVEHRRILPSTLFLVAALSIAMAVQSDALVAALTGGIFGLLAGGALYAGGRLYRRTMLCLGRELPARDPLGAGDALLAGACGLYAGWPVVVVALLLAVILAGVTALALLLAGKATLRSTLPYAPFLLAGTLLATRSSDMASLSARLFV